MSDQTSIYVAVVPEDPHSVFLIRRDYRATGYKEEFLRIPNDLIKTAIEQLLRVLPEPEEAAAPALPPSSAPETGKRTRRNNAGCVRCGHASKSHLHRTGDCFGKVDGVPCTCLKYLD